MAFEHHHEKMVSSAASMATRLSVLAQALRRQLCQRCGNDEKLVDVLDKVDEPSLSKLVLDHESDKPGHIYRGVD